MHVGAVDPAAEHRSRGESERDVLWNRLRARRGQTYTLSRPKRLREKDGRDETATVSERDGRSPLGRQRRETLPAERVEREKDGANARKQWLEKDGQKRNRPKKRSGTKMGTRIDSGRKRREIDRRTKEREEERERKREGNARVARGLAKETKVSRSLAVDG